MSAEHIHFFLRIQNAIKLYHWQTNKYSRHMATDKILESIQKHIDSFVELYIGRYGKPKMSGNNAIITLHNLTDAGAVREVRYAIQYLERSFTKSIQNANSDLFSIRDDILGDLYQLLYLFTLQ